MLPLPLAAAPPELVVAGAAAVAFALIVRVTAPAVTSSDCVPAVVPSVHVPSVVDPLVVFVGGAGRSVPPPFTATVNAIPLSATPLLSRTSITIGDEMDWPTVPLKL